MHAFTLAEVLITLVIIGVVAALTIPNLMQKYTEQTTVKKVKKFYSTLSNAYSLARKENGPVNDWNIVGYNKDSSTNIYEILFKPYFKIAKDCGLGSTGECVTNAKYKKLDNTDAGYYNSGYIYKLLLDDGSAALLYGHDSNTVSILYDTNGIKAPNQRGKDFFSFVIVKGQIFPEGIPGYYGNSFNTYCTKNSTGNHCTAWVIYKGNMDYLHCDDLSWTGKDKCK